MPGLGWTTTGPTLVLLLLMCSGSAPVRQAGAPRVVVIVVWLLLLLFLLLECVCEVTGLRWGRLIGAVTVAIIGVVS